MPIITTDTFDPLRRYISVRLQQAVPIVDADWNENDDITRFELRAFIKWFIGNGIPAGLDDAFRIAGTGDVDNFNILAGSPIPAVLPSDGLSREERWENGMNRVGRCLVDGMDVIIAQDIAFRNQPLHDSQPGAATLAARLGVPVISMPAPADGQVLVYLDIWERLVRPLEDPALVHPGLGVESCVRMRREWAVRVRQSDVVPQPGNPDYIAGHSYYALASITRRVVSGVVNVGDVIDLRQTGLTLRQNVKTPLFIRQGPQVVDGPRFALMLLNLRNGLFTRLRTDNLPHATATPAEESIFVMALQQVMNFSQTGEIQMRAGLINNQDGLRLIDALYDEQVTFLDVLENVANVGDVADVFLTDYRNRLDGNSALGFTGLRPPLDANNLFAAVLAQEEINQFLATPSLGLPSGSINVFYVSATPFAPLAAGTNYTFRFTVESLLSSPLGSEDITLLADLSAASWEIVSLTPSTLTLANNGGTANVEVVVRPNAATATSMLTLTARSARNPLLTSSQPGLNLTLGAEPPAGNLFLFYADNPLNAGGQLEVPQAQLTDPFGRSLSVRLLNNSPTEERTYRLVHTIAADDGDDAPWIPNVGAPQQQDVTLLAGGNSIRLLSMRCTAPTVNETAVVTVTATVIAVGGAPVADGAENTLEVSLRVIA